MNFNTDTEWSRLSEKTSSSEDIFDGIVLHVKRDTVTLSNGSSAVREEMTVPEAKAKGAIGLFESKYGEIVSTYKMGDYSFEICKGPHAQNTGDLGSFKIRKEESSSAGVRRIKATIQPKA